MTDQPSQPAQVSNQPKTFRDLLLSDSYQTQISQALPRGLTADRMARVVLTAMNKTPKLLDCTKESLWESVLNCASLGLFPDSLGRAYLVPYGKVCQLIIGYKGLIDLAYRSERIGMIQLKAVYEGDDFLYEFGLSPSLKHTPCASPGKMTHAYSIVHIKGADMPTFDVMRRDEIEAIRSRSRAKDSGPWQTDYAAMAMKTVFRRHSKVLPMSSEMAQAMDVDADTSDLNLKSVEGVVAGSRFTKDGGEEEKSPGKAALDSAVDIGALMHAAQGKDSEDVDRLLQSYSANSFAEVPPDQRADFLAALLKLKSVKP